MIETTGDPKVSHAVSDVQWSAISARIQTRSHEQCRHHWGMTIKSGSGILPVSNWLPEDDLELAKRLQEADAEALDEINWDELRWGMWSRSQIKGRWVRIVKQVPDYMFKTFRQIIDAVSPAV